MFWREKMKGSTRRAMMSVSGLVMFTAFFIVVDVNILEIELHHLFMLIVISVITGVNMIYYVIEKRREEIESR